jgi:replicative DNA helicase
LGAILLDNTLWPEAAQSLIPDHFSLDAHRRIFSRMRVLQESGRPVDMITLVEELDRRKEVEAIGGVAYLSSLIDGVPERPSIEHYIRIVRNKAMLRGLINLAQNAIAEAIEHADEPEEVVQRAERSIVQLAQEGIGKKPFVSLAEATISTYNAMTEQGAATLETSLLALDEKTSGGIWPEELWILGGDPGSGKSVLALQIAAENGRHGKRIAFFSLEMKTGRIMRRLWCYESGLLYFKLKRDPRTLSPEDQIILNETINVVAEFPMYINDLSSLQPQKFAALARHAVLRDKAELVVLDHIQLMTGSMPGRDEVANVMEVSATLRQFAKDYCPVLALSQLSRMNKDQRGQKPTMRDLKGSSALEQDASVILLTWRPKENGIETGEDEILVEKNREGEPGIVPVRLEGALMRYEAREVGL